VDEFVSFFVTGMDTTAHLIAIMTYNLHEHPEKIEKTRRELYQIYPLNKQWNITIENIDKLEQMQCVISETLRYNSPVFGIFVRQAVTDHMIGDIRVKKDMLVTIDWAEMGFNPKIFEEPEKLRLER